MSGGELTTEVPIEGGRPVSVFVPDAAPEAVIYTGDGQLIAPWGADLIDAEAPPTLVVGTHRVDDEDERLREYSPGFEPERFEAHERYLMETVRGWVAERFGVAPAPERTAVYGTSAGGELALALGVRHPDVFGSVLCASPGAGYRPPEPTPANMPRTYLVAGVGEPFFWGNAIRWAVALGEAGVDCVMTERNGDHGDPFWREEFPLMVRWAFGGEPPAAAR